MKNIAIFGASRAGKSTLVKMICEKYPNYHMIIGDAIRKAFSEVLPQNDINNKNGNGMKEDFPKFLAYLFYRSINLCNEKFNYIIDSCDISPEKAKELFARLDTLVIFLGFPEQTEEQHFIEIRKYEEEKDWTYHKTEEYMKKHSKFWTMKSREWKEKCEQLDIWYVDTSFDREDVLKDTMCKLEELIL